MMADVDEGVAELFLMEEEVYSHSRGSSKYCGLNAYNAPDVRGNTFFWTELIIPENIRARVLYSDETNTPMPRAPSVFR